MKCQFTSWANFLLDLLLFSYCFVDVRSKILILIPRWNYIANNLCQAPDKVDRKHLVFHWILWSDLGVSAEQNYSLVVKSIGCLPIVTVA